MSTRVFVAHVPVLCEHVAPLKRCASGYHSWKPRASFVPLEASLLEGGRRELPFGEFGQLGFG